MISCLLFCSILSHAQAAAHFSGAISTVGSGFNVTEGIAIDAMGDVFVADSNNNAVKEIVAINGTVSSSSTVITIGSGFYSPAAVALDASGDLFVADQNGVYELAAVGGVVPPGATPNPIGSGFNQPGGIAVDNAGDVFVADTNNSAVKEIVAAGGVVSSTSTVIAVGSGFIEPVGVAVDANGDVFVGDTNNSAVYEIVAVGGAVSTGSTVLPVGSGFSQPTGLTLDSAGDVFVADSGNSEVYEIVAVGGTVSSSSAVLTIGGGLLPWAVTLSASGNIFVSDSGHYRVVEVQPNAVNFGSLPVGTTTPTTLSLTFTFDTGGTISAPSVLTQGTLNLDFTDAGTGSCTTNGTSASYNVGDICTVDVTFSPTSSGLRHGAATLSSAGATIATGNVYGVGVAPQVIFSPGMQMNIGSGFNQPSGMAVDGNGDVFVADSGNNVVYEVAAGGGVSTVATGFSNPQGLAIDGAGDLFVADSGNAAVKEIVAINGVVSSSSPVVSVGSGFSLPVAVAVDASGDVFIADGGNAAVYEILAVSGSVSSSSTVIPIGSNFGNPTGLGVDGGGDVFVSDQYYGVVDEIVAVKGAVSSTSQVIQIGSSTFQEPISLAVDGSGNILVSDSLLNSVFEIVAVNGTVSAGSSINTVAGGIYNPAGIAVSSAGNVYVAEPSAAAAVEIDFADAPLLSFAPTAVGLTSSDSPQTITLTNNGNAPLTLEVPAAGVNPSISAGFTYGNNSTCPQLSTSSNATTLAPGAACTEIVSFSPTGTGPINGSLATTDNTLNAAGPGYATQAIALGGNGAAAPTLTSISPNSGTVAGATSVSLTGTGLTYTTAVNFGAVAASSFTINNDTSITAISPAQAAGTVDVTVTAASATTTISPADEFTYFNPTVTAVSPATGTVAGGTNVTITGTNLSNATAVTFGGNLATIVSDNPTQIVAISPAGTAGVVDVQVTAGGTSAISSADQFTYVIPAPAVTAVSPASGVVTGGASVTITGTYLSNATAVTFGGNTATIVSNTPTQIVAISPVGTAGVADVQVTTGSGTSAISSSDQFTYFVPTPTVTSLAPRTGTMAGGTTVTITGTNLSNATAVTFGGNAATIVSDAATQIVATSPAGSGVVDVQVTTGGGTTGISTADQFSYQLLEPVGSTSAIQTATLTITTAGTVASIGLLTQGASGLDFQVASGGTCSNVAYSASQTCTVNYTFTPASPGIRLGAAVLYDSSGSTLATTPLNGVGLGPLATFAPGTISTIAGGFDYPLAVALDGAGDVFVADNYHGQVKKIVAVNGVVSSSSTILVVASGFSHPSGLAVDGAGNVFFADYGSSHVYKIVAINGSVSSGSAVVQVGSGFNQPDGLAVDSAGNVFVADSVNGAVKKIVAVGGTVSPSSTVVTVASGMYYPIGVAVDASGNLFVAQRYANAVVEIVAIDGVASSSSAVFPIGGGFSQPTGVAVDSFGNVYVADEANNAVKEIVAVNGVVSSSSNVITLGSGFNTPFSVALDGRGNVFVPDHGNNLVKRIDLSDPPSLTFASTAVGETSSDSPQTVTLTNNGNAPLTFEAPSTGLNPSISAGFTFGSSSTCPQLSSTSSAATLAAGATCTEVISFTPVATGSINGTLVTTDNYLNAVGPSYATQTRSLSGTGTPALAASTAIPSTVLLENQPATAFSPITGTGGSGTLTYSVSPALPTGLSLSTSTSSVTGTPTVASPATTYTVTVTDAYGATATATFSLAVNPPVTATTGVPSTVLTQSHPASFTPVTGSGGVGPLTYSVSPSLPAGLTFSTSTGTVSGTATVTSTATTYTVTVTDADAATATATFSLTVNTAVTATNAIPSTTLTEGHAASFLPVTGSGGTGSLTYSVSPGLPAGLTFSTSTGTVSGTATATSSATTYTVTVTDADGATATATFSLTVNTAVTATNAIPSTTLTDGHAASFLPVTGSGGTGSLTYSVAPALPAGLTLSSATGTISGTATATSTATTYTVTVTDADAATATATFSLTVNTAVTATNAIPSTVLTEGHAASFLPVTGSGGTGSLTYSVAPALPAGLTLSSATGTISGTATATSTATTYTVTVTDADGATATATFSLTVNSAVTATNAIPSTVLTEGHAASFLPVTGSGGTGSLTYSVSPGLPAGLTFSTSTGTVSGTATATSSATTYTVTVTDADAATATATFSLTVNTALTATTSVASTVLTQGHAAAPVTPVTVSGGTGPLTYSVSPGLPAGMTINPVTGAITGTPTATSSATTYTVTVTDADGATATATFSLTVNTAVTATNAIPSTTLTDGHAASFLPVTGSGGTGSLTYSVSPGLPAGLTFSTSTGTVSGTATATSTATTYTVTVTDADGATATATFSLTVNTAITATTAIPSTTLTDGHAASFLPVTGSGGTGSLTYSVSPGLPAGLTFSTSTGTVSGTATVTSTATTYTVTVTDADAATATATFSLTVNTAVTATNAIPSTTLTEGHAASFLPVTGSGGTGSLTYSVSPGLPAGLTFSTSTGTVSGTATATSSATTYTVTVTDADGATATATFSLTVNTAIAATTAIPSTVLTEGHAASFLPVTGSGGTGSLTYSVAPALPAGLTLSSATGTISGTATATSTATTYTVTVTDADAATATATFSLTVNTAVTATNAIPSTVLTEGHAASFLPVTGSGGTGSLTYSVAPALPAGLTLSSATGTISGTATATSTATTYTVTVTDADGATATATFSLTVNSAVTATNAIPSTVLTEGHAASFLPVTGSGGTGSLTYSVSPGLPAGLTFSTSTGTVSGTATATSSATTYTVTVTDADAATATATFSLTVNTALTATTSVASTVLTQGHAAAPVTPVTVSGGTGPLTYSVSPGLPAGMTINPVTGAITGTPTATSTATTYTVTVTDADGATATATFSLTVNSAVTATNAIPSTVLTEGHAASFLPVTGSGGTGSLTYSVSPGLPAGLTFSTSTGTVSGTATATSSATTYTVTVTDADAATATATFSLTVNTALTATTSVASTVLTQGHAAAPVTPVTVSGGTGPLTYSVSPGLPAGMTINPVTGAITGTPTATSSATTYTVTVTDADGATATATFSLTVNTAIAATTAIPSTVLTEGHAASFLPVTGSGGTGSLTYSVAPALPAGLTLSSATGTISGTATATSTATTYTVTVTDADGATATATFSLTVNSAVTATNAIPSTVLTEGHAASFLPVTGSGGTGSLTYSVSPGLPAGLTFSTSTGTVSGTATATSSATTYTVTVTDADAATATATFSLTVNTALTATTSVASTVLTQGHAAAPVTPVTVSGGTGPLTYSVSPGLPAGMTINPVTGAITGTPTATSSATTYTVTVTDADGATATATFSLTVNTAVTATNAIPSTTLTNGHAASFLPVTGSGGTGSLTYSVSPGLPAGLTFSTSTGTVSGTATATSSATTYTVTVTDADGATATATFSLTVNTAITATTAIPSTTLTDGHAASFLPVTGSGGTGSLTYSVSPGLPAGLTFSTSTGTVSGTATVTSTATTYTVTVTDADAATATATFSLTVNTAVTATNAIPSTTLTEGHAASFLPVTGSGGTGSLTYSVSPGLPAGLTFSTSTGTVSGTATATSSATTYTVTVTDADGATATATFSLTVNTAIAATTAIPSTVLTEGHAASFLPVTGSGGTGSLTYSVAPALPAGLTLSSATGTISGTATATSTATTYTVTVTDADAATATATFSLTVNTAVTATNAIPSTVLTEGHAASFLPVTGSGGTGSLTYSVAPALPAGLTLSSATGTISGTATATSTATTYTVTVTDADGATATATFSLTVNSAVTATNAIPSTVLTEGHAASFLPVTGSGGTGSLTYSVSPGLPAGLTFSTSTGTVSGTATATSSATTYTVTVTDADAATATATFSLTVNTALTATTSVASTVLTQGHAAAPVTPVTVSGGTGPLTYSVSPGLPAGMTINPVTGAITGTPTATSSATTYTVTVTDADGATATATFSLTVNTAVTATNAIPSTTLTNGHAASFLPVTGSGGTGSLTYSVSPGLPAGLTFSTSTGTVSGTATATSSATTYTVTVTDADGATATATFSLTVNTALTATTSVASTVLTQGHAAALVTPVTVSGGTGPLTYSVSPGLPAGMTINPVTGAITGTPTATSSATTYTVTVTDADGATATATFSLTVNTAIAATTAIPSTVLTEGHAASFLPVTGSGGTGSLTYSVAPALPAGLTLSSATGTISGTATATSTATTYTVTVTDADAATATATFSLTVNTAVTATNAIPSTTLTEGHAASFLPVTGSGGTGSLTYSVAPALPAGLTLSSATGTISGTATATSTATTYTVTVTDADGATATATFSLTVNSAVTATNAIPSTVLTDGHAASFLPVTGSGGTGSLTYSVSPGLPAGLTFSTSTGTVSGTATATSSATTYTVTVTDADAATATATFSLTVNSALTATTAVASTVLTQGHAAAPVTPVTVSGGTGPLTYSVSPGLPAGMTINPVTGAITGTPTATSSATTYTVTVTDADGATATATFSLTVNTAVAVTVTSLTATPATQMSNNSVVLKAQVTSPAPGVFTGTVTFLDGTNVIATVPVGANGQATYSDSTFADGSHTLMAAYSGDTNYLPSSSEAAPLAITIADFNLGLETGQKQSVVPGGAVTYNLSISPLVTPTLLDDVHLSATGLPPGATYTFSPEVVSAGSTSTPVFLKVQTSMGTASLSHPAGPDHHEYQRALTALAFGLLFPLVGAGQIRRRLKAMPKLLAMVLFSAISLGTMLGLSGCGGGGFFGPTSTSGTYTITVNATSGNLVRTSTVQLVIH